MLVVPSNFVCVPFESYSVAYLSKRDGNYPIVVTPAKHSFKKKRENRIDILRINCEQQRHMRMIIDK